MNIEVNNNNLEYFKCLSSKTRLKIIELLNEKSRNIGELADLLGVSSAMVTRHVSDLVKCNIITTENIAGKRGLQKICTLSAKKTTLIFGDSSSNIDTHNVSIPVGQYTNYEVNPTCGLASKDSLIGICDQPRYFSSPDRFNASIVWFQAGLLEYCIPGYIVFAKKIDAIEISLEICSEFPGYKEDWPSDIYFYLNDIKLGVWVSPGDFGKKKGVYTPEWWNLGTQYGLLKTVKITSDGTFLDGIKLSEVTLERIEIKPGHDMILKIAAPENTQNPGGITIFGKGFGNYNQDIDVRVKYI